MHDRIGAGTVVSSGAVLALMCMWTPASAQDAATSGVVSQGVATTAEWESAVVASTSELRDLVSRYSADRSALLRRWNVDYSRGAAGTDAGILRVVANPAGQKSARQDRGVEGTHRLRAASE